MMNVTKRCADSPPYSGEFFKHISQTERIFFIVCLTSTILVIIEYATKVKFVLSYYGKSKRIMWKCVQILGVYPAVAVVAVFALFVPRADLICDMMVSIYLSRSMFNFVALMEMYFGGTKKLEQSLRDKSISYRQSPCCCCLYCLPKSPVNKKSMLVIRCLVLQGAILLPVITTVTLFMWVDGRYQTGNVHVEDAFPYLQAFTVISMLATIWGFQIYYDLCKESLRPMFIVPKFITLKAVIILTRLQRFIVDILAGRGIPTCDEIAPTAVKGMTYYQIILIFEVTWLSFLARKYYLQPQPDNQAFLAAATSGDCVNNMENDVIRVMEEQDHTKIEKLLGDNSQESDV